MTYQVVLMKTGNAVVYNVEAAKYVVNENDRLQRWWIQFLDAAGKQVGEVHVPFGDIYSITPPEPMTA